jgi:hypothetical protein
MSRILIYILVAFIGTAGTWVANRFQIKKAIKPYKNHVQRLQADSTLKSNKLAKTTADYTLKCKEDSIKAEFISQMQGTMNTLKKENTLLKRENQALVAWKEDAQDGIVTDTVNIEYKTNIFGKRKRIK